MKRRTEILLGTLLLIIGMLIATVGIKGYETYVRWEQSDNFFKSMQTLDNFNSKVDKLVEENEEHIEGIKELEEYRDELISTIKEYEKLIINRDDAINELHATINQRDNTINELTKELQDLTLKHEQAIEDMGLLSEKIEKVVGEN